MQVIGVGYGRTGTHSLKEALDILGYTSFHTEEMMSRAKIFDMFYTQVFLPEPVALREPDFDMVAQFYNATTDMPLAFYFRELKEKYPQAKFILTTRQSTEKWTESWITLINNVSLMPRFVLWLWGIWKVDRYNRWILSLFHQDESFLTKPHPLVQDKLKLAQAYEHHNAQVRLLFQGADNFFDYLVSQGWEPLCKFLGTPVPHELPFPHRSKATDLPIRMWMLVIVLNSILVGVVGVSFLKIVRKRPLSTRRKTKKE